MDLQIKNGLAKTILFLSICVNVFALDCWNWPYEKGYREYLWAYRAPWDIATCPEETENDKKELQCVTIFHQHDAPCVVERGCLNMIENNGFNRIRSEPCTLKSPNGEGGGIKLESCKYSVCNESVCNDMTIEDEWHCANFTEDPWPPLTPDTTVATKSTTTISTTTTTPTTTKFPFLKCYQCENDCYRVKNTTNVKKTGKDFGDCFTMFAIVQRPDLTQTCIVIRGWMILTRDPCYMHKTLIPKGMRLVSQLKCGFRSCSTDLCNRRTIPNESSCRDRAKLQQGSITRLPDTWNSETSLKHKNNYKCWSATLVIIFMLAKIFL